MNRLALCLCVLLVPTVSAAEGAEPSRTADDPLGSVVGPATLPAGATALYGYMGAPEVGAGFRQGIGGLEMEARARFDWFKVAATLELAARKEVLERGALRLAPVLGVGVVLNSGATYLDSDNFSGVLMRVSPGMVASWRMGETAALLGLVDLPFDFGLGHEAKRRFQALGGGGVELYLGDNLSLLAAGQLGVETFQARSGLGHTRLGFNARVGLGTRLF
ncbi:hypothetical protein DRW03_23120 [Corallococcus sp. H22C18031201]|uniref:hypothetical protein n=1 Tax=Citreicoccus inhibens TaxID=2849499 RepID=UPI000E74C708|nr:hypothetical protein [Citreicoccus inhibens]MBU8897569.1 hypothetical protein [Citreicoccus inhibens]RJS19252.1 hypothetical protein DRW03_23120 [Corallococcus sp. H22C18031201]